MNLPSALSNGRKIGENFKLLLSRPTRGIAGGGKQGRSAGTSLEFREHREYKPGDDIRRIDWRAYARTDKYVLKLYQEEIQPFACVLSDVSSSMIVPSEQKIEAAAISAGIMISSAINSEASVSWWTFADTLENIWPLSSSFPEKVPEKIGEGANCADILPLMEEASAKYGVKIIISDFLWQIRPSDFIRPLLKNNWILILLCVLCKTELNPSLGGVFSLSDAERGGHLDIEIGEKERTLYKERIFSHLQLWKEEALRTGAVFQTIEAEKIISKEISGLMSSGILQI
jgi:hypothetical protein